MRKRSAFIGLSGPIGYDYKKENKLNETFPNPILEAPLGLMALYDEVVFLDEAVCPKNMANLDFVKFISDKKDIASYIEHPDGRTRINEVRGELFQGKDFPFNELKRFITKNAPFAIYDNHSRHLSYSWFDITPNSNSVKNVIYDNIVAREENLSLVTNSLIDKTLTNAMSPTYLKGNLANNVIAKRIPNVLTEKGPYLETIYEIRDRHYVKEFRRKIDSIIENRKKESLNELTQNLEIELNEIKNDFTNRFLKKERKYKIYFSIGKIVLKDLIKSVPIVGQVLTAYDGFEKGRELYNIWKEQGEYGWAGFLVDLELSKQKKKRKNKS
jgi:hypothetical protein